MVFCPDWLLGVAGAEIAKRYVSGSLPIEVFCTKYSERMLEYYEDTSEEKLKRIAVEMLQFVAEIEHEDFTGLAHSFCHNRVTQERPGKPRKFRTMFRSALDPVREEVPVEEIVKTFRAFVFTLRATPSLAAPKDWQLQDVADLDWFATLMGEEVSVFDSI